MSQYPAKWDEIDLPPNAARGDLWLMRHRQAVPIQPDREASYVLGVEYAVTVLVDGEPHQVEAPAGMLTDLASVPRLARPVVGRVGPHLEAAIIHDWLYVAWQVENGEPRKQDWRFANVLFHKMMRAAGMGRVRAWLAWLAVASPIGWRTYRRTNAKIMISSEVNPLWELS